MTTVADKIAAKAELRLYIKGCQRCPLHQTCASPVPIHGPTPCNVLFIGEAPGQYEDEAGRPFVGSAGNLLRGVVRNVFQHNAEREVAYMNVVCCRPPKNRTPYSDEVSKCQVNMRLQIALANPRVIVLLGGTALSVYRQDMKISQDRGRPFVIEEGLVAVPTWHPAYVARKKGAMDEFEGDIRQAHKRARKPGVDTALADWPGECRLCGEEVGVYDPQGVAYCDRHGRFALDRRENIQAAQERMMV